MADADYGYVGAGRNKISLYRKKVCVERNIPEEDAVEHLLALIKSDRATQSEALSVAKSRPTDFAPPAYSQVVVSSAI